jgi:hypothetical protein
MGLLFYAGPIPLAYAAHAAPNAFIVDVSPVVYGRFTTSPGEYTVGLPL